jgi:hypothetical protein
MAIAAQSAPNRKNGRNPKLHSADPCQARLFSCDPGVVIALYTLRVGLSDNTRTALVTHPLIGVLQALDGCQFEENSPLCLIPLKGANKRLA